MYNITLENYKPNMLWREEGHTNNKMEISTKVYRYEMIKTMTRH